MRLFQNSAGSYRSYSISAPSEQASFAECIASFHADGFDASHTLAPIVDGDNNGFYTHGSNETWQRKWAGEKGMASTATLADILLAQIEDHRTEVFYNLDPIGFDSSFSRRLPATVKAKIAWQQFPHTNSDYSDYLMICTLESRLQQWRGMGLRTAYFWPSHHAGLDRFAANETRDIDVVFAGSYSQYHVSRAVVLEALARLGERRKVVLALVQSRLSKLADTPLGLVGPLRRYRRPAAIRKVAQAPVFGSEYYRLLSRSKIVFNRASELEGQDRGNMRCWEAMGTRSLLVSDDGIYPDGMADQRTIRTYTSVEDAMRVLEECIDNKEERLSIAQSGYDMVRTKYSKAAQWDLFQRILTDNFRL